MKLEDCSGVTKRDVDDGAKEVLWKQMAFGGVGVESGPCGGCVQPTLVFTFNKAIIPQLVEMWIKRGPYYWLQLV